MNKEKQIIEEFKKKYHFLDLAIHFQKQLEFVINITRKSQRKEIVEKIEKGGYIIGKREGDAFKEEDTKEFINLIK